MVFAGTYPVWCALAVATHFAFSFAAFLCCCSPPGANSCARITKQDCASWRERNWQPWSARHSYTRESFSFFFVCFGNRLDVVILLAITHRRQVPRTTTNLRATLNFNFTLPVDTYTALTRLATATCLNKHSAE